MKKLFTLFCLVAMVCVAFAQTNYRPMDGSSLPQLRPAPSVTKRALHNGTSRAATDSYLLDYDGNDDQYSTDNGFDYKRYIWNVNQNWSNTDNFQFDYMAVYYDTLQYLNVDGALTFIPRAAATITLDSFDIFFIHTNTTGNNDSIRFTVFNRDSSKVTNYGAPNSTFTTPKVWDTLIVVNTSIPLNATNFTILTFAPHVSFPQGKTFGIRADFKGDTANKFDLLVGMRDQCAGACQAELSKAGNNTAYYLNLTQAGTPPTNFSGHYENVHTGTGNLIYFDCDNSNGYTPGGCENMDIQNLVAPAYVTITANYGAVIVADSVRGCPGATLNLTANGFGSNDVPYTYNWATTTGTLTSLSDQQVGLVIGNGNAVVTVTVTDANNQSTTATINVTSRGININIVPTGLPLVCGSSAQLNTQVSGITAGRNYSWSTGATGTAASNVQALTPGTYSVTN